MSKRFVFYNSFFDYISTGHQAYGMWFLVSDMGSGLFTQHQLEQFFVNLGEL